MDTFIKIIVGATMTCALILLLIFTGTVIRQVVVGDVVSMTHHHCGCGK